ncbi:MAG: hypothetical protein PVF17_00305 [Ignavibacteria bacterium]|jgi:hypothetical protein
MSATAESLAMSEGPEVLLVRSLQADNPAFTTSGDRLVDCVYAAFADQITSANYLNDFASCINPEYQWCHAKLSGTTYPSYNLDLAGYDLTHSIFYTTDFGRSPVDDTDARTRLLDLIAVEQNADLLGEYAICLMAVGGTPTTSLVNSLQAIEYTGDTHLTHIIALVESYGLI